MSANPARSLTQLELVQPLAVRLFKDHGAPVLAHEPVVLTDTGGVVLPNGIKAVITEGPITIWVYECPPSLQRFLWIAADSPVPFGPGTQYRPVRLALPYLILLVVFAAARTRTTSSFSNRRWWTRTISAPPARLKR